LVSRDALWRHSLWPYANRNHFAGFAELILPRLSSARFGRVRRERWPVVGLFAVIPIGALFLSASRGGIAGFAVDWAAALLMIRGAPWQAVARCRHVLLTACSGLLAWVGQILQRFPRCNPRSDNRQARLDDARHLADFSRSSFDGTGLGTLQVVFPPYETLYDGKIVNHSHNDYLSARGDGTFGGLCCAGFLASCCPSP